MIFLAKFAFRLNSYLGVKEKIEDQKKLEYGKALNALELERQEKKRLLEEKNHSIRAFRESVEKKISPIDIQMHNHYLSLLKKKIIEQEKSIQLAEKFAEKKRLELVEAMKERKILDKLKEKDFTEYVKSEQLKEQKVLDEIVSYQYNNREK